MIEQHDRSNNFLEQYAEPSRVTSRRVWSRQYMRWKICTLSFVLTLAIGIGISFGPTIPYRLWPAFDKSEVDAMVGRRVRYRPTGAFRLMKSELDGYAIAVQSGEYGTIIGAEPVPAGYFLVVRWYNPNAEDYQTYIGRYSYQALVAP